jgi:hypothetical protein
MVPDLFVLPEMPNLQNAPRTKRSYASLPVNGLVPLTRWAKDWNSSSTVRSTPNRMVGLSFDSVVRLRLKLRPAFSTEPSRIRTYYFAALSPKIEMGTYGVMLCGAANVCVAYP